MSRHFPWTTLGIDQTHDTAAIRRAYADALRGLNVDEDIAGYATLRHARDEALWLAAQGAREDDGDYGLGALDDDDAADDIDADADFGDLDWDDSTAPYRPAPLSDAPDAQQTEAQRAAQDAWQALTDILYPGGEPSEASVTYTEMEAGLAHLGVLLARAEQADLAEHDALDGALADVFARTWPRSAPFVEPANAALHWLEEAGSLEERPALMFLNARIKGMRFHEKVQAPGHPLNAAWVELSRPGSATFIDRLRVKRLDIDKLLTGLRQHYPELESYLEPERVASWEGSRPEHGVGDTGPKVVRGLVIVMLVMAVPRLISSYTDPRRDDDAPPIAQAAEALQQAEIDVAVADIFGSGMGMAEVRAADPVFADQLRLAFTYTGLDAAAPLELTRAKALGSAEVADYNNLAVRVDLKGMWLAAAQRKSDEACGKFMRGELRGLDLGLSVKERERERALLRQLLEAKVLGHQPTPGQTRFSIPGWLVSDTLTRSGWSEERLVAALTDPNSPDRCTAEAALIAAALATSQRMPVEVLRGL